MSKELKPCKLHPKFEPRIYKQRHGLWVIFCDEPDCVLTGTHELKQDAVIEWNKLNEEVS